MAKKKKKTTKSRVDNSKNIEKDEIVYAMMSDKFKAFITDTFMIITPIMYLVIYLIMGSREEFRDNMADGWSYISALYFVALGIFHKISTTPGLKNYKLQIIDMKSKKPAPLILIMLRYVIFVATVMSIVGLFFPYFRKDRRALYDLLLGTSVVYEAHL